MLMLPTPRGKGCFRPAAVLPAAALLVWLPGFHGRAAAQDAPGAVDPAPLATVLEHASEYVTSFQADFARVVGLERYRQEVHAPAGGELADLESEVFFVGLDDRHTSLTVRNVLSVNGRSVSGAD